MKRCRKLYKAFALLFIISILLSCNQQPDPINWNTNFKVSSDTLSFDTIVSTFSTTTLNFRIINPNNTPLNIKSIYLANGDESSFRLNIDGTPCQSAQGINVYGWDSIFVFVEATFPEFDVDSMLYKLDSIVINTDKFSKSVKLIAWSQDVNFVTGKVKPNEVWDSKRPYLIMDSLEIAENETLIIEENCKVFFHNNAYVKILGTLIVKGTHENPVIFSGDRFDESVYGDDYEMASGQWAGLVFYPSSKGNNINHAIVKNGIFGIWAGAIAHPEMPEITISNSIFQNHSYASIVSFGARINCNNTFFGNSNKSILLYSQGSYNFNHITILNEYDEETRKEGSVFIQDYIVFNRIKYLGEFKEINFNNSIIYGNIDDEINIIKENSNIIIPLKLNHCLIKQKDTTILQLGTDNTGLIFNEDPLLVDRNTSFKMHPDTLSPFIDKGDITIGTKFTTDLLNNSRLSDDKPDLGAIEFIK